MKSQNIFTLTHTQPVPGLSVPLPEKFSMENRTRPVPVNEIHLVPEPDPRVWVPGYGPRPRCRSHGRHQHVLGRGPRSHPLPPQITLGLWGDDTSSIPSSPEATVSPGEAMVMESTCTPSLVRSRFTQHGISRTDSRIPKDP